MSLQTTDAKTTYFKPTGRKNWLASVKVFREKTLQLFSIPLLLLFTLPLLALFLRTSPPEFLQTLKQSQVVQAVSLSLFSSLITTVITIIFGMPVSYVLSKRKSRFIRAIDTIVDLPTVLPPSVAGVALLMAFGRNGILGQSFADWGITIPFTTIAVIIAQIFIASPLFVKAVAIGFSSINTELEQAAALDGANQWQIFRYITISLSAAHIVTGSVMTWARALGEFGATIIFAGNFPGRTQTMPLAIYIGFEIDMRIALTLTVILILFSFFTLALVKGILHEKLETTGGMFPGSSS